MHDLNYYVKKVVSDISSLVSQTMGPDGKYVLVVKQGGGAFVTKDGVTVAKNFKYVASKDISEEEAVLMNSIASIYVEMARKTDYAVGDGTTSTIWFASVLYEKLEELVRKGYNLRELLDGVRFGVNSSKAEIAKHSYPVKNMDEVERIAFLSSNNDEEASLLLRNVFENIGKTGMITFNSSNAPKMTEVKYSTGFRFPSGYAHKSFVNVYSKKTYEHSKPYVLVTDFVFSKGNELLQVVNLLEGKKRPLLLVCENIYNEALAFLAEAYKNQVAEIIPIKAPFRGVDKEEFFEDLCIFSGAKMISSKENIAFPIVKMEDLGTVGAVESGMKYTVLIESSASKEIITSHVESLKKKLKEVTDDAEIEMLYLRISRFSAGAAEIYVGGSTESEVVERRYRLEDSLKACNNSFVYGYVPGGGLIYLFIKEGLKKKRKTLSGREGAQRGFDALCETMDCVLEKLIENSGYGESVEGATKIKNKILKGLSKNMGFDFRKKEFKNFLEPEHMIIEPAGISQEVLENSLSIVSLLLNTVGFTF